MERLADYSDKDATFLSASLNKFRR